MYVFFLTFFRGRITSPSFFMETDAGSISSILGGLFSFTLRLGGCFDALDLVWFFVGVELVGGTCCVCGGYGRSLGVGCFGYRVKTQEEATLDPVLFALS